MIPDAVASTGPYVGLWGHLKSIDHALRRVLNIDDPQRLTALDRDRLCALINDLQCSLSKYPCLADDNAFLRCQQSETDYNAALDFSQKISDHPDFKAWRKSAKESYAAKIERLVSILRDIMTENDHDMFSKKDIPKDEIILLRKILKPLLSETEAALY